MIWKKADGYRESHRCRRTNRHSSHCTGGRGQCRHTGIHPELFTDIYEVITAKDGKEGWELAQARIPNIIVSDIMMPVMDGIELCKRIKEDMRTSHIPVILLTAKDSLQDKEEGYASGADSYLTKPFSAKLLHSRINNLLETRKKIASLLALADTQPKQESAVSSLNKLDNEFLQKITQIIEENLEMERWISLSLPTRCA